MLPLLSDRMRVVLQPDQVLLLRHRKGMRPRVGPRKALPVAAGQDWRPAMDALREELQQGAEWVGRARLQVLVSSQWVRYVVLPWNLELKNHRERLAFARMQFQRVHGEVVAQWDVRISEAGFGEHWLAAAMDLALVQELEQLAQAQHWRLVSVQPYLMAAANTQLKRLSKGTVRLFLVEPGKLTVALLRQGAWHSVKTRNWQGELDVALFNAIQQERLLEPLPGEPDDVCVFVPGNPALRLSQTLPCPVHYLEAPPSSDAALVRKPEFSWALGG